MSVYSKPGKGWRYDFTLKGQRYTEAWFKTKAEAKRAEALKREEVMQAPREGGDMASQNPVTAQAAQPEPETPTGMGFLELVNEWLDELQASRSLSHYQTACGSAKKWIHRWGNCACSQITTFGIRHYIREEKERMSIFTANKELRYLRAMFNYGKANKLFRENPTDGIGFFPDKERKRRKYVPSKEDLLKVISVADPDTQDYLWVLALTGARMGEVNQMTWDDVDFDKREVTLWTCKTKNGERRPRGIPMCGVLHDILLTRRKNTSNEMQWVFWHTYWDASSQIQRGPYSDRKRLMASLCKKADVAYFRFHAIRHLAASLLDDQGVPIGAIQRILGHQNRSTTEGYIHSVGRSEKEAIQTLEGVYGGDEIEVNQQAPRNTHRQLWKRKVVRPSIEQIRSDVKHLGYRGTGKKYGVSDNAVRKWLKSAS